MFGRMLVSVTMCDVYFDSINVSYFKWAKIDYKGDIRKFIRK